MTSFSVAKYQKTEVEQFHTKCHIVPSESSLNHMIQGPRIKSVARGPWSDYHIFFFHRQEKVATEIPPLPVEAKLTSNGRGCGGGEQRAVWISCVEAYLVPDAAFPACS